MKGHKNARQYNDQVICEACGKQWDVNDPEPPECDSNKGRNMYNAARRRLRAKVFKN